MELVRNFFVYSFGALFLRGISFFLIPVYTRVLLPSQYGQLELINTFAAILDPVCSMGLAQVVLIEYFHLSRDDRRLMIGTVVSAYLLLATPLYLLIGVVMIAGGYTIFPDVPLTLVYIAMGTAFLTFFQTVFFTVLRFSNRAVMLTVLQVALGLGIALLNIAFLLYFQAGIAGIVISGLIGIVASLLFAATKFGKKFPRPLFTVNRASILRYLSLSLPFVPGAVSVWLMNGANRWILQYLSGDHAVGIYSVASKFGGVFDPLFVAPLLNAYLPFILKKFSEGKFDQKLRYVIPGSIVLFGVFGIAIREVAKFIVDPSYAEAIDMIPVIVVSYTFWFLAQFASSYLIFHKKITAMLICVLGSAVSIVVLNFVLIPVFGIWGAVFAGLLGYALWFLLILWFRSSIKRKIRLSTV